MSETSLPRQVDDLMEAVFGNERSRRNGLIQDNEQMQRRLVRIEIGMVLMGITMALNIGTSIVLIQKLIELIGVMQ